MAETTPIQIQDRDTFLSLCGDEIEWRYGQRPDYSMTDITLKEQSQFHHAPGSLESIAQNLVRAFEMEATYKLNAKQWESVDPVAFKMTTNNGPEYTVQDIIDRGTYNLFLDETPYYSSKKEDFESSYAMFQDTFKTGYLWELVEVYSGPPKVAFKWRHWGTQQGKFQGHEPTNKMIEVYGMSVAEVNADLKITRVEHMFDTAQFLQKLTAGAKCPVMG